MFETPRERQIVVYRGVYLYVPALYTDSQEKALVALINDLTSRRISPTTAIVKNLAKEIRGYLIKKN